jgi:hypothetical protein
MRAIKLSPLAMLTLVVIETAGGSTLQTAVKEGTAP